MSRARRPGHLPPHRLVWIRTADAGLHGVINKYLSGSLNGYQIFTNGGSLCAWYFRDAADYVWDGTSCTLATPASTTDSGTTSPSCGTPRAGFSTSTGHRKRRAPGPGPPVPRRPPPASPSAAIPASPPRTSRWPRRGPDLRPRAERGGGRGSRRRRHDAAGRLERRRLRPHDKRRRRLLDDERAGRFAGGSMGLTTAYAAPRPSTSS